MYFQSRRRRRRHRRNTFASSVTMRCCDVKKRKDFFQNLTSFHILKERGENNIKHFSFDIPSIAAGRCYSVKYFKNISIQEVEIRVARSTSSSTSRPPTYEIRRISFIIDDLRDTEIIIVVVVKSRTGVWLRSRVVKIEVERDRFVISFWHPGS